ncbi:MAG: L-seryl-tRNA(Sec) selenium transferase [Thermomicrobiales bacterium]
MARTADGVGPARRLDDESPYRALPSVSSLIDLVRQSTALTLADDILAHAIQLQLEGERRAIAAGAMPKRAEIVERVLDHLRAIDLPRLRPLINATGILVHTNLGRAPVSAETARSMAEAAASYVALEINADTNERGGRMREIATLMRLLTGAEDCIVVNNNAAAVLLVLSALAAGRSVVMSRGEAVEIGGGFRVPDVLMQSGAILVEVGTTNRTYAVDYERAIDDSTAVLLKVHPSNFRMSGFVHSASVAELAAVASARQLPVVEDLGSGALLDTSPFGLGSEPTIGEGLRQGASLVTASGDKLLGGPQAGIIAGSRKWVEKAARHPLARAVRADKTCLAGVAATLRHYARGEAISAVPVWRMIADDVSTIRERAESLAAKLRTAGCEAFVVSSEAAIGGGSLPGQTLPSAALTLVDSAVEERARRLRLGDPPVFGRIENGRIILDLRSVLPEEDDLLFRAILASPATPVADPSSPESPDYRGSTGSVAD